jgi:hypothetical protein
MLSYLRHNAETNTLKLRLWPKMGIGFFWRRLYNQPEYRSMKMWTFRCRSAYH